MITEVELSEFKCFHRATLPFEPLTVLTGTNGSGKSTVIQALLALRQSWEQGVLERGSLALNGDWVHLGTGQDVLHEEAEGTAVGIRLGGPFPASWKFVYDALAEELGPSGGAPAIPSSSLFSTRFQYLCAERIGPRSAFAMADHQVRGLRLLGPAGQYTAQFLAEFGAEALASTRLVHAGAASASLHHQTEAWLGVVANGARVYARTHREMDVAQLQFAFASPLGESNRYRPTNVGFGLTYALPVLVAVLSAKLGGLVVVENPEAHLHPRGQAEMGRFLALAAADGIQIVVETHSDHVLNGIRVAAKDGLIDPERVAIHFFSWDGDGGGNRHRVDSPRLGRDGRLDSWPPNFFDQWDRSLDQLLG